NSDHINLPSFLIQYLDSHFPSSSFQTSDDCILYDDMESPEIHSAILGWDWGSTAIRVSLLTFQGRERILQDIFNTGSHPGHDERYQKGAFNSALYLDGKGDVYLGERMDDSRIPAPSKELFSSNSAAINSFKAINKNLNRGESGAPKSSLTREWTPSPEMFFSKYKVTVKEGICTVNGCMFTVVQGKKQVFSYYRVGDTFCKSVLRLSLILGKEAEIQVTSKRADAASSKLSSAYQEVTLGQDQGDVAACHRSAECKEIADGVSFGRRSRGLLFGWDKRPIELAKEKIAEAATLSNRVRVVVSGGSGKSSIVQAYIWEACRKAKIDDPFFFHEKAGDKDSWNISKGAAIATATTMTGLEFIERGAAFGIQVGHLKNDGGSAWKRNQSAVAKQAIFWQEEVEVTADTVYPNLL
ncbi:hypothetical protein CCUS01_15448, partial [Colletotrichum cuscutae]